VTSETRRGRETGTLSKVADSPTIPRPSDGPRSPDSRASAFGPLALGQERQAGLHLENTGTAPFTVLSVGEPSDPEFTVILAQGSVISQGETIAVPLSFKPFSMGQKSATVTLQTDSPLAPTIVLGLTGTGLDVKLVVTPQPVDFGNVVVHSVATVPVTLLNDSAVDLTLSPGPIEGPDPFLFSTDLSNPFVLAAHATQTIDVTFAPLVAAALDQASFTLTSNAGASVTVGLRGVALASGLCISPPVLYWETLPPGAKTSQMLTVFDCGNQTIDVISASVTDQGKPPAFSAPLGTGTLVPGQELQVMVSFEPPAAGHYTGQLDIVSTDVIGDIAVTLQGNGSP